MSRSKKSRGSKYRAVKAVKDFYTNNGVNLNEVVKLGMDKYDLSKEDILYGAYFLYKGIEKGMHVDRFSLIWMIIIEAKKIKKRRDSRALNGETSEIIKTIMPKTKWERFKEFFKP